MLIMLVIDIVRLYIYNYSRTKIVPNCYSRHMDPPIMDLQFDGNSSKPHIRIFDENEIFTEI